MTISRRGFLGALIAAPWVIRSGVLMPVRPRLSVVPPLCGELTTITINGARFSVGMIVMVLDDMLGSQPYEVIAVTSNGAGVLRSKRDDLAVLEGVVVPSRPIVRAGRYYNSNG